MNSEGGFLQGLMSLIQTGVALFWTVVAIVLDFARDAGPITCGVAVILAMLLGLVISQMMQGRLNRLLGQDPGAQVNIFFQELMFTLPGLIIWLLLLPFILIGRLLTGISKSLSRSAKERKKKREEANKEEEGMFADLDKEPGDEPEQQDAAPEEGEEDEDEEDEDEDEENTDPVLVASIGPSLMGAAVICALLYIAGIATEPLLRVQLGLSEGMPAWEYLLIGDRPELQWYLPLSRYPWMGGALTVGFWFYLWWWIGRIIRMSLYRYIGENLIKSKDDDGVLPWWRTWFGSPELFKISDTYLRWARWLPIASAPFLVFSWLSLAGDPYRMSPSMFAVSLLLTFSWALHFATEGLLRDEEEEEQEEKAAETITANVWEDVLGDVKERFQIKHPHLFEAPRAVEELAFSTIRPESENIVSPLLTELLPEPRTFTHMQYVVLRSLSLLGYIHTDPPLPRGELELGSGSALAQEESLRHRNQIVLAPEGSGKSTMAMLAACNHAIIHTRCSLIITRDDERALQVFNQLRAAIEPSTLRWNIRERRVGGDLVNDLAQGIIPDIIVCSLRQLVVNVLDEPQTYVPFLENLGLIIVDDVESFCGPVETHAQLAIRRLQLRVSELLGVKEVGEELAPMMLVLGTDSMHDTPAWARTLCGVDAVARYFDYSAAEATTREEALKAYQGISDSADTPSNETLAGTHQLIYRLSDFRNADDEVLDVQDIIESCERHAVPWHYRPCGDERRHLGRQRLHLRDEPKYFVDSPMGAGVIFLQGHWAEVQREISRLKRAGSLFEPIKKKPGAKEEVELPGSKKKKKKKQAKRPSVPVAIVTIIDRDEEMALTELNQQSSLSSALTTLPRPVVRPPTGQVVLEHLSAEMTSNWVEVSDVLDIFGNPSARVLTRLADAGMLMSEERVDLHEDIQAYENKVYVRATSRALGSSRERQRGRAPLLPGRVNQVELPSGNKLAVRDRTNLNLIDVVDAESVDQVYYMGRIFENAQGRFVVVGRGEREQDKNARDEVTSRDLMVEPYLGEGVSSPRRRTWIYHCEAGEALARHHVPHHPAVTPLRSRREELPVSEPVMIGDFPVATSLSDVSCIIDHIATYRLGEKDGEVRQRTLFDPDARNDSLGVLNTMAMGLYPNPNVEFEMEESSPKLRLEEARLIAAAMRAVLPSMYRGAGFSLEVGIHIEKSSPEPDHVFTEREGFFFFDPQPGGNGASRAMHRDGVELLLRLCRVYIERVLYHDRLRARYDYWGDEAEIVAGQADGAPEADDSRGTWFVDLESLGIEESGEEEEEEGKGTRMNSTRQRDRELRKRALIWLDSRLRPEGSLSGGQRSGSYGSGSEEGEGDVSDIGRCWYSRNGTITDLLWTKHRWRLDDEGGEAMADLGFDRDTAASSRFFGPESQELVGDLKMLSEQLQNPAFNLSDQTVWGTARPLWSMKAGDEVPVGTDGELILQQPMKDYQLFVSAIAAHDYAALEPLALLLQERAWTDSETVEGRYALIDYVTRFVQGIPSTGPSDPRAGTRPPVHTLLHRLGDTDSKSIVLAILLRHIGFDTGLFVSLEHGAAMCAVAVSTGGAGEEGDPEVTVANIKQWKDDVGLGGDEVIWGELPSRPGGPEGELSLYVPIDPMRELAPGKVRVDDLQKWAFVPLAPAWFKLGVYEEEEEGQEPSEGDEEVES